MSGLAATPFEVHMRLCEESVTLSLMALLEAYCDQKNSLQDPQKEIATFLENVFENQAIDYVLLQADLELLEEITQNRLNTISPLKEKV